MFCHYLSVCTFTALARAEDNMQDCVRHFNYLRCSVANEYRSKTTFKFRNTDENSTFLVVTLSTSWAGPQKPT